MSKILKILGKRGRITIPYPLRVKYGYSYNDIVSFEDKGDCIAVKREKLCDDCRGASRVPKDIPDTATLFDFLNGLTEKEQHAALIHLSVKWAEKHGGGNE
jgi:bifunctional DNA-binding transcriptional regulator/antitoxin component of YhaV-PrlF toxin-antitoxin module